MEENNLAERVTDKILATIYLLLVEIDENYAFSTDAKTSKTIERLAKAYEIISKQERSKHE